MIHIENVAIWTGDHDYIGVETIGAWTDGMSGRIDQVWYVYGRHPILGEPPTITKRAELLSWLEANCAREF
jgi:hypothetical protein